MNNVNAFINVIIMGFSKIYQTIAFQPTDRYPYCTLKCFDYERRLLKTYERWVSCLMAIVSAPLTAIIAHGHFI